MMLHSGRNVATPVRAASSLFSALDESLLEGAGALLQQLPEELRQQARLDLARRLSPEIQAWIQKYDHALGGTLEPEEADSDEDCLSSDDEIQPKRRRQAPPQPQDGYPEQLWRGLVQGKQGFNAEARKVLQAMLPDGARAWSSPTQGQVKLLKQQAVVSCLVHPKSPVTRILLDHNTGSGKTLCMLRVLDNFFFSEKPKIVIVPKDTVMWNLYATLWQYPSRWRDYAAQQCPKAAELACGAPDWRRRRHLQWHLTSPALCAAAAREGLTLQKGIKSFLLEKMRDCLEMKRAFRNGTLRKAYVDKYWASTTGDDVHLPSAPLRIYRFTSAGGRAAEISEGSGLPRGCVFKVGFAGGNPYNGKVILMDEGHHLVRPSKLYETQLSNLRKLVKAAKNSVFVSLTGSMADSASDAGDLLKVVKGIGNEALSDEGFLSSHCRRGASFPTQRPAACADGVLSEECDGLVHREELAGFSLARYMYQSIKLHREKKPNDGLACYANIHCYMNAVGKATCKHQLMHHDDCRPKFTAAVNDVVAAAKYKQKSMVMVSKRTGYKVMLWLLEAAGKRHKFNVAHYDHMADFNRSDNARGEKYMVLLLAAEEGESIELKCVRWALILDVPRSYRDLKQRCGRVVRCGSHDDLPQAERDVRFKFYVAEMPEFAQNELGSFALWALCGYWNGPKRINYQTEPEPENIQDVAEAFVDMLAHRSIDTLQDLAEELAQSDPWELVEAVNMEEQPKLARRLHAGLLELQSADIADVEAMLQTSVTTCDETNMAHLVRQVEETAPALDRVRCNAIDAGFY